jgi:hypothetical protein
VSENNPGLGWTWLGMLGALCAREVRARFALG